LGRYSWGRVRTNRHKTNKQRDVSDAHLDGRLSLLELDLEELGNQFPVVSEGIKAEIKLIQSEIRIRKAGGHKPSPPVLPEAPHEWDHFDSLADLENTTMPLAFSDEED